jgi:hypothetical protein
LWGFFLPRLRNHALGISFSLNSRSDTEQVETTRRAIPSQLVRMVSAIDSYSNPHSKRTRVFLPGTTFSRVISSWSRFFQHPASRVGVAERLNSRSNNEWGVEMMRRAVLSPLVMIFNAVDSSSIPNKERGRCGIFLYSLQLPRTTGVHVHVDQSQERNKR